MKFRELGGILCMRGASLRMKGVVYKACVHSVLTYGAETWAMKVGVFQRLQATERRMLRMICGVMLEEHLKQKKLRWFRHIVRRDGDKENF